MISVGRKQKRVSYRKIGTGDVATDVDAGFEVYRPHRSPELAADTAVPFVQSLITAMFATAAVFLSWNAYHAPTNRVPWSMAAVFAVVAFLAWVWSVGAVKQTWWLVERFLNTDLDGDGHIGDSKAHLVTINGTGNTQPASIATVSTDAAHPEDRLRGELVQFVKGCAHDTSMRRWESKLGRERYVEFRDHLMRAGCATWKHRKDKKQGWILTLPVNEVLSRIA